MEEECDDAVNERILEAVLKDDVDGFIEAIDRVPNPESMTFGFTQYFLPRLISSLPPLISLCAYFKAIGCMNYLRDIGADMQQKDQCERTPLFFAMASMDMDIVRWLNVDAKEYARVDAEGNLPVHVACEYGFLDAVKMIYMKSTSKLTLSQPNYFRVVPLLNAAANGHTEILDFLKRIGINILDSDGQGQNGLFYACRTGFVDAAKWFIDNGIDIDKMDHNGNTALSVSCTMGNLACVKLLLESGSKRLNKKKQRVMPLVEAARNGHIHVLDYLISQCGCSPYPEDGNCALEAAVAHSNVKVARYFLRHGHVRNDAEMGLCVNIAFGKVNSDGLQLIKELCQWAKEHNANLNNGSTLLASYIARTYSPDDEYLAELFTILLDAGQNFTQTPCRTHEAALRRFLKRMPEEIQERVENEFHFSIRPVRTKTNKRVSRKL